MTRRNGGGGDCECEGDEKRVALLAGYTWGNEIELAPLDRVKFKGKSELIERL